MTEKVDPDWWNPNPRSYCVLFHYDVIFDGPDEPAEHMLIEHGG